MRKREEKEEEREAEEKQQQDQEEQEEEEVKKHCWMEVKTEKRGRRSEAPWRRGGINSRLGSLVIQLCTVKNESHQWSCSLSSYDLAS